MPKRIKLEVLMEDGTKIKLEIPDGSKDKVENFLKLLELYKPRNEDLFSDFNDDTLYFKIYNLIKNEFGIGVFTLGDLYTTYLLKFGEKIKKSTLSTYLSRLVENGMLVRYGKRGKYKFKLMQVERGVP
jgi:hypothetical protein